jgi:DNA repair protein RadC
MHKETTSTNSDIGDEVNKDSDLEEINQIDPRTALAEYGSESLSLEELLAVLLSLGCRHKALEIASNLLKTFDNNLIDLFCASIPQLIQVEGIGFAKACILKAAFGLTQRIESYTKELHPKITSTEDVVRLLAPYMRFLKQEEFRVLLLDSQRRLIYCRRVALGTLDRAIVDSRDVLRPALTTGAASIILVHNHPSRDPTPSEDDILLTRRLCLCGGIVEIEVLDHVIIGLSGYVSLKEKGGVIIK